LADNLLLGGKVGVLILDNHIFPWEMCFIWGVILEYSRLAFG